MFLQTLFSSHSEFTINGLPSLLKYSNFTQLELSKVTLDIEYKYNGEYYSKTIPEVSATFRLSKQPKSLIVTCVSPFFRQTPFETINISIPMSENKENTLILSLSTILINNLSIFDACCQFYAFLCRIIVQQAVTSIVNNVVTVANQIPVLTETGVFAMCQDIKNDASFIRQKLRFLDNVNWRAALDFPFDMSLVKSLNYYDWKKLPQFKDIDFSNLSTLQNLTWSDMLDVYDILAKEGYLPQMETVDNYLKDSNLPSREVITNYITNTPVYKSIPPFNEIIKYITDSKTYMADMQQKLETLSK